LPCAVIAVQRGSEFLSLFVTVSFLKVRVRARQGRVIRNQSFRCVPSRGAEALHHLSVRGREEKIYMV